MIRILILLGIVSMLIITIVYRFNHIDMTETRLFLNQWYWYLAIIICSAYIKYSEDD